MSKSKLSTLFTNVKKSVSKHSPEILTGVGIAGMITTTVLAVKATPKALELLTQAEDVKFDNGHGDALTIPEKVKVAWKPYIPAIVTGVASVTCLIGASSVNAKRNAALATAYELSKTALADYREKVVEEIGEEKERVIREKVAQEKLDKNPPSKTEIILTGQGEFIFLEPVSERYFKSDIETIRKIINDLNYRLTSGMTEYISLSEFYDEIGLSHTAISDDIGWNMNEDGLIGMDMPAAKTDKGEPCLVLDYHVAPRYDYSRLM